MFRAAAAVAIPAPTAAEPVKLTPRTAGSASSAGPSTEPAPSTTLKTPGGSPAASALSAIRLATCDAPSAGLSTTVFPKANAGAAFQRGIAAGKFHGVISATTPSGSRRVNWMAPSACAGMMSPILRTASPA